MKYRMLELTLISAQDLHDVRRMIWSTMDPYVVVTISGDPLTQKKTTIHKNGGTNPIWNFPMRFIVDEALVQMNCLVLDFQLWCDITMKPNRHIGEVQANVKDLLDNTGIAMSRCITYHVSRPSGRLKGVLNFSYNFSDVFIGGGAAYPPYAGYPIQQ